MAGSGLCLAFVYPQLKRLTGAQRLIIELANALAEQGHAVTLVTHRLAPACRTGLGPGVDVVVTGRRVDWTGAHLLDSALEYGLSLALVQRLPPAADAVVFFGPPSLPALALARRRGRRRLISFCYEPPRFAYADRATIAARFGPFAPLARAAFGLYRPIDRRLLRQADLIAANGRFGAAEIEQVYGRPAVVIDHGVRPRDVPEAAIAAASERWRLGDAPVLLTVNHLHPRKRIDLFLATVARVRAAVPTALGLVVGEGADRTRLERIATDLRVSDAVRFTGFVDDDELATLYRRASVYLHTGQRESFGLSVLEAAASGRPVVAVDDGGPRDILEHGRFGRLCPASPDALVAAVLELLSDPAAAARLGASAAAHVRRRYQWENGAAALVAAVRGLQAGRVEAEIVVAGHAAVE
ncbi:MAG: glycosyltransferase family 4 protein [Thermomicrobiales bacterium]|nr:glycosyltransferase family 4 protein [Thermomicrobiales bacterium]